MHDGNETPNRSVDRVARCLAAIDAWNPHVNAMVTTDAEGARQAARDADAQTAAGRSRGLLHGVPVIVKDNLDTAGLRTTYGSGFFADHVPTQDAHVVARLRQAGAVIVGKATMHEFAYGVRSFNPVIGQCRNPWNTTRIPGGSSGGASSAVAAGMGPIAHGNDLAGSVRYPAYCTGIYGLRPSFGRVPAFLPSAKEERPPGMQMMSVQGPLARTVADLRLALHAMAARDVRDPWWVPAPLEGPPPARPLRVAMTTRIPGAEVHPAIVRAVEQAGEWLAQAGYAVEAVEPPDMEAAQALWFAIADVEVAATMAEPVARLGDANLRQAVAAMHGQPAAADTLGYLRVLARRTTLVRNWQVFLERYPLVLGPVCAEPPFPWGLDAGPGADMARIRRAQGPQMMVPLLGLPGLSAPLGSVDGVPIGVQLIAGRFREDLLLQAAEVLESRHPSPTPVDPAWAR